MTVTVSDILSPPASGDHRIDSLIYQENGFWMDWNAWGAVNDTDVIDFCFELDGTTATDWGLALTGAAEFTTAQRDDAIEALAEMTKVTGIQFRQVTDPTQAEIKFIYAELDNVAPGMSGYTTTTYNYRYSAGNRVTSYDLGAHIVLDPSIQGAADPEKGTAAFQILLHEVGHAIGLCHPFSAPSPLPTREDNTNKTVMSYTWKGGNKSGFRNYDRLALRYIYGADGLGGQGAVDYDASARVMAATPQPGLDRMAGLSPGLLG
ncbi:MAG: matrixin family metalloprotease [Alphaproteobacteria bacterium]|nr:matrixin family metalloprotease [Alphaproteobacteria bacterium]